MDRIWQWAWDWYGARYSWAIWAIWAVGGLVLLPSHLLLSFVVVAFEGFDSYVEAAGVTVATVRSRWYTSNFFPAGAEFDS